MTSGPASGVELGSAGSQQWKARAWKAQPLLSSPTAQILLGELAVAAIIAKSLPRFPFFRG
jgi:hypothetical protein